MNLGQPEITIPPANLRIGERYTFTASPTSVVGDLRGTLIRLNGPEVWYEGDIVLNSVQFLDGQVGGNEFSINFTDIDRITQNGIGQFDRVQRKINDFLGGKKTPIGKNLTKNQKKKLAEKAKKELEKATEKVKKHVRAKGVDYLV